MARKRTVAKGSGLFGKLAGAVFGGLVAPLAVLFISRAVEKDGGAPPAPGAAERVVIEGAGRTPQEALDSGLRGAVRGVAADIRGGAGGAGQAPSLPEAVLARAETFVLRW